MSNVATLIETFSIEQIILFSIVLVGAVYGVIEAIKKGKKTLDEYYYKRKALQVHDEEIEARFVRIEETQADQGRQLKDIKSDFNELKQSIEKLKESQEKNSIDQKRIARAQAKSTMTRLADEILIQNYASTEQNEVLSEIVNVYMQCSNTSDGYIIPPRVSKALHSEVLNDEEIEKLHREAEKKHGKHKNTFGKTFRRMPRR